MDKHDDLERQFQEANAAIERAVIAFANKIEQLFGRWEAVAPSYIVQRALRELCEETIKLADHPVIADFVGPATLRLSNALADYRDALPRER